MSQLEVTDQHLDRHQRGPAATEEQLRHAGDRRLRPPADADRRVAESLDRAAGEALDFLSLPNGKKIMVPFDQFVIFSTNLEPRELVDEAFLRRIPYKIEVIDPTEDEFHRLFE